MKLVWKKLGREKVKWVTFGPSLLENVSKQDVQYVGSVYGPELAKLYSSADVMVVPSWYESFPLQPLESMACGTVVITTRYGTEDYAYDNENSLVVYPRRINEMAEKIIFGLTQRKNSLRLVKNGLETVKNFTWQKATDKLEQILEENLEKNASNQVVSDISFLVSSLFKGVNFKEIDKILSINLQGK